MTNKGFKNLISISKTSNQHKLRKIAKDTLRIGELSGAVELPEGENINEWLAVNAIEFYNEISLLFGCLTEFCTSEVCPTMCAGPKFEYLWTDPNYSTKPMKVPAKDYINYLMTWVENQINNPKIFPTETESQFSSNFIDVIKLIFKRLFRVYAHIYYCHFYHLQLLEADPHLNTSFKHFVFFIDKFELVSKKDLLPLNDLITEFKNRKIIIK